MGGASLAGHTLEAERGVACMIMDYRSSSLVCCVEAFDCRWWVHTTFKSIVLTS